jgi:phospholipase C
MRTSKIVSRLRSRSVVTATILALVGAQAVTAQAATSTPTGPSFGPNSRDLVTQTPIKHVINIIGENRTFDNVFATYAPKSGETVWNLLSEKIVNADGTPGPSYSKAKQFIGSGFDAYKLAPPKTPYVTLPAFHAGGGADKFGTPFGCAVLEIALTPPATNCNTPANVAAVMPFENGLSITPANSGGPIYYQYLLTGGTGQTASGSTSSSLVPDARVHYDGQDASSLPNGPFQISETAHAPVMPYDAYTVSPVHRLFQMWQELDCSAAAATTANPSGCRSDLWPWVESTIAAGSNGAAQPADHIGEGSTSMFFYNVQAGDAPYLKSLADAYTMSDNYHQAVLGGTGAITS